MTTITTITEAIETITTVLGEYANDFDIEGMARELTDWKDGKMVFDEDRIFEVAPEYDTTGIVTLDESKTISGNYIGTPKRSGKKVDAPTKERITVELNGQTYERTIYERTIWHNMDVNETIARFVIINGVNYVISY